MTKSKMNEVAPKSRPESAMLAANKCSHVISKSYSAVKDEGKSSQYSQHKNIIAPTIRVVYVYEPKIIKTDPQNFRSVVQRLTGKPTSKSKKKKRHMKPKSPSSEVISAEVGPENLEDDTFYSNHQLPIGESRSTNSSTKDCFSHCNGFHDTDITFPNGFHDTDITFSYGFHETDITFPGLGYQGLLHEIPPVKNNSPFCNMYDQAGVYRCT